MGHGADREAHRAAGALPAVLALVAEQLHVFEEGHAVLALGP